MKAIVVVQRLHESTNDTLLARLRRAELDAARRVFAENERVLEIGGGDGLQASILASWGCRIESIDVDPEKEWQHRYFPVQSYDGVQIPFPDASFDKVFSSNVLEHVNNIPVLFREMVRVMRPGGIAVHILPTPAWRFWTMGAHYPFLLWWLVFGRRSGLGRSEPTVAEVIGRRGLFSTISRALWPSPHGQFSSSISEFFLYRRSAWEAVFRAQGCAVEGSWPAGVFYTGYALFPWLSMAWRKRLARLLGSACRVFVLSVVKG